MARIPLWSALIALSIGAAIGYVAASSDSNQKLFAAASKPATPTASNIAPAPVVLDTAIAAKTCKSSETCCSGNLSRGDQLALAVHNQLAVASLAQTGKKPNILVIFGDDIGQTNISAYSMGVMGYRTPNIDRIAREGMIFTDYYAEQSCTAGRSSFITGQCTFRTGLSKVGVPGATVGLQKEDPTIAELLKNHGYSTGQFGKNHLGDMNAFLPTAHGFDEFFGNLYHLNAEEEPEQRTYPGEDFKRRFGPRGVLRCKATDKDDPSEQPRWGRVGRQLIADTGPLTKKRMETIDDETSDAAIDYMQRQTKTGKPFFCWYNSTRMHLRTHVAAERRSAPGLTARTEYADGMVEHDGHVGKLLKTLDDLYQI